MPKDGLNVALIDPFALSSLSFETVSHLASFRRMDLIVFFPVGEIRRWYKDKPDTYGASLDRALGTPEWRSVLRDGTGIEAVKLIQVFRGQLSERFDYTPTQTYSTPIRNHQGTVLYHLVFASKHPKADQIWSAVTRRDAKGQRFLSY